MKIKILKSCSGYNFSFKQNDVIEVENYIGKDLVNCGFAESFTEKPQRKRTVKKNADA